MRTPFHTMVSTFVDGHEWSHVYHTVYGEKPEEQSITLHFGNAVIDVHGVSVEYLNKLADDIFNAARAIEERRKPLPSLAVAAVTELHTR